MFGILHTTSHLLNVCNANISWHLKVSGKTATKQARCLTFIGLTAKVFEKKQHICPQQQTSLLISFTSWWQWLKTPCMIVYCTGSSAQHLIFLLFIHTYTGFGVSKIFFFKSLMLTKVAFIRSKIQSNCILWDVMKIKKRNYVMAKLQFSSHYSSL